VVRFPAFVAVVHHSKELHAAARTVFPISSSIPVPPVPGERRGVGGVVLPLVLIGGQLGRTVDNEAARSSGVSLLRYFSEDVPQK
jgi:hypothetical protein